MGWIWGQKKRLSFLSLRLRVVRSAWQGSAVGVDLLTSRQPSCYIIGLTIDSQGSVSAWDLGEYPPFSPALTCLGLGHAGSQVRTILPMGPDEQHHIHLILAITQTSGLFALSLYADKTQWIFPQKPQGYIFQSFSKPTCTVCCIYSPVKMNDLYVKKSWATILKHSHYFLFCEATYYSS